MDDRWESFVLQMLLLNNDTESPPTLPQLRVPEEEKKKKRNDLSSLSITSNMRSVSLIDIEESSFTRNADERGDESETNDDSEGDTPTSMACPNQPDHSYSVPSDRTTSCGNQRMSFLLLAMILFISILPFTLVLRNLHMTLATKVTDKLHTPCHESVASTTTTYNDDAVYVPTNDFSYLQEFSLYEQCAVQALLRQGPQVVEYWTPILLGPYYYYYYDNGTTFITMSGGLRNETFVI